MQTVVEEQSRESKTSGNSCYGENFNRPAVRAKVLVVDDDKAISEILALYLSRKGLQVSTARTMAEATTASSQLRFDLVILDWDMAGVETLELLDLFKSKRPELPVIIFAGRDAETAFLQRTLAGRASAILQKLGALSSLGAEVERQLAIAPRR